MASAASVKRSVAMKPRFGGVSALGSLREAINSPNARTQYRWEVTGMKNPFNCYGAMCVAAVLACCPFAESAIAANWTHRFESELHSSLHSRKLIPLSDGQLLVLAVDERGLGSGIKYQADGAIVEGPKSLRLADQVAVAMDGTIDLFHSNGLREHGEVVAVDLCKVERWMSAITARRYADTVIAEARPALVDYTPGSFGLHPRDDVWVVSREPLVARLADGSGIYVVEPRDSDTPSSSLKVHLVTMSGRIWSIELDQSSASSSSIRAYVASNGDLLLCMANRLIRVDLQGRMKWSVELPIYVDSVRGARLAMDQGSGTHVLFESARFGLNERGELSYSYLSPRFGIEYPIASARQPGLLGRYEPDEAGGSESVFEVFSLRVDGSREVLGRFNKIDPTQLPVQLRDGSFAYQQRDSDQRLYFVAGPAVEPRPLDLPEVPVVSQVQGVLAVDESLVVALKSGERSTTIRRFDSQGQTLWTKILTWPVAWDSPLELDANHQRICASQAQVGQFACLNLVDGTEIFAPRYVQEIAGGIQRIYPWVKSPAPYAIDVRPDSSIGILSYCEVLAFCLANISAAGEVNSIARLDPSTRFDFAANAPRSNNGHLMTRAFVLTESTIQGCAPGNTHLAVHDRFGALRWQATIDDADAYGLALADDGAALLHAYCRESGKYELIAVDATGQLNWRHLLSVAPSEVVEPVALAVPEGGWIIVSRAAERAGLSVYRLDAGGSVRWTTNIASTHVERRSCDRNPPGLHFARSGQKVLIHATSETRGRVHSIDVGTGAVEWAVSLDHGADELNVVEADLALGPCGRRAVLDVSDGGLVVAAWGDPADATVTVKGSLIPSDSPQDMHANLAGFRGIWSAADSQGQGLLIDSAGEQLFGAWFTFAESGKHEHRDLRWMTFQGRFDAGAQIDVDFLRTTGGAFVSDQVAETARVGTGSIRLIDCNHLILSYQFESGGLSGAIPLPRLGERREDCMAGPESRPESDGAWFDPGSVGQGLLLQTIGAEGLKVGAWFAFDPLGKDDDPTRQHWFTLQSSEPGQAGRYTLDIYRTIGGSFDAQPTNNTQRVGSMVVTQTECSRATLNYQFDGGEIAGAFAHLQGLVTLQKLNGCAD